MCLRDVPTSRRPYRPLAWHTWNRLLTPREHLDVGLPADVKESHGRPPFDVDRLAARITGRAE
jgi:hypothetical protein